MLVVSKEDVTRFVDVAGPVLCLAVYAHDAVVAANALIVFRRNAARVVECTLTRKYHRCLRRRHQNASSVHQHGSLGVPVWLCSHVDPINKEIDFTAGLSELHQPAQDVGDPVHILHAALHRDFRPGGDGEPFQWHLHLFG